MMMRDRSALLSLLLALFNLVGSLEAFKTFSSVSRFTAAKYHGVVSVASFNGYTGKFPQVSRALTRINQQTPFDSWGGGDNDDASLRSRGLLVLSTVPLAWGSFEPAVRLVFQIQPDIPPFVFSFLYYLIAASALLFFALRPVGNNEDIEPDSIQAEEQLSKEMDPWPYLGGLELGTYLFIGNGLQVVGLKTVPSDRAAFLLQLTAIFVPLLEAMFARNLFAVPKRTWLACMVALCGVAFFGLDDDLPLSALSFDSLEFSQGDSFIIAAAASYSFHCIRLEGYAKTTSAVKLAAAKATTETVWSSLTVLACVLAAKSAMDGSIFDVARQSGENILAYQDTLPDTLTTTSDGQLLTLATAVLWTGLVTVAYTVSVYYVYREMLGCGLNSVELTLFHYSSC
jgi:hypothetical protein